MVQWHKWNRLIHRDLGYLAVALTLIYAVSGLAVNHIEDWNPNYTQQITQTQIDTAFIAGFTSDPSLVYGILGKLQVENKLKNHFRQSPTQLNIFLEGATFNVNTQTGEIRQEWVRPRFLLKEFNALHLNHPKEWWTWIADLYAVVLIVLAITGLFIIKGPKGITGRGAWLTAIGLLIPLLYWIFLVD